MSTKRKKSKHKPGKAHAFFGRLEPFPTSVLASAEPPGGGPDRIVRDPAILGGKPVIRGSRISVEHVLENLGGGATIAEVARSYRLSEEDIRAALAFAGRVVAGETVPEDETRDPR